MNKLIKLILIFTIFIIPLFYLPFTQEQFQFNKEMLFLILMLIAGVLWFGKAVRQKKLEIIRSPMDVPILLIPLVYGLSTVISPDWLNSLINLNGAGFAGLTTILSLTLFYFICVNVFIPAESQAKDQEEGEKKANLPVIINLTLIAVLASSFIAQIIFYLSIFNVNFLPGQNHLFNTLGQSSKLMMFVALTIPIILYFILSKSERFKSKIISIAAILYLILSLLTLNTVNYASGWMIVAAGSFVFLVLFTSYYAQMSVKVNKAWLIAAVLAVSLISIIIRPSPLLNLCFSDSALCVPQQFQPNIPAEITLSKSISGKLAISSSLEGPVSFIAGAGPGNFAQVFSQYRPEQFNNNPLWQVRFNRAANFFYETIATIGWLGVVSFLMLFVFFIATAAFLLFRARGSFPLITLIAVFAACLTGFWVAVPSLTMLIILWLAFSLTSIIGILNGPENFAKIEFNFSKSSKNALFLSFGLVFAFVLLLFFMISMGRLYLAEFYYKKGLMVLNQAQTGEDLTQARSYINKAISINQRRAEYYLDDAKISLAQLEKEIEEQEAPNISSAQLQTLLAAAVNQSKKAELLKGYSVSTWETRGMIFESISKWTSEGRIHAINAFEQAINLEPSNPVLYYKLGDNQQELWRAENSKVLSAGEKIEDFEMLDQAQKNLEKAIELKQDYVAPRLVLAKIFETRGDAQSALGTLKAALMIQPNLTNAELYYELSRLMYNQVLQDKDQDLKEKSKDILPYLNKAIELSPNYSNALYTRSLIYRQLGNIEEAITDMEEVIELNPDNKEPQAKLKELKQPGRPIEDLPESELEE
ncbi:MAG: tetratricopeptide repeat protein [Patescibacteria group bacterium]